MKNYFLILISALFVFEGFAQRNAFKINLAGLIVKNISVQYERKIGERTSVALAFRDIPYGKLPFSKQVADVVDNPYVKYNDIKISSLAVLPEFRYYLGRNGAMQGFYIGTFGSYSNNKCELPILSFTNKLYVFKGSIKTFTGGIQIGSQFKLSDSFFLDWWIIGPNYGGESGDMFYTGNLTPNEQMGIEYVLKKLQHDVPFSIIRSYSIDANGAVINAKGPWAGLRGLGINLAYHF